MDQTNLAVVHRLSKKLPSDFDDLEVLPSLRTLQSMSSTLLNKIDTVIAVPLAAGGTVDIKVVRPQEAVPYLVTHVPAFRDLFDTKLLQPPCTLGSPWKLIYHEAYISFSGFSSVYLQHLFECEDSQATAGLPLQLPSVCTRARFVGSVNSMFQIKSTISPAHSSIFSIVSSRLSIQYLVVSSPISDRHHLISFSMFVATLVYRIAMATPLSTFASGMVDELMDSDNECPPSRSCGSRASLPMRVSAGPHTRASPYPAANAPQLQVLLRRPGPAGSGNMAKADSALNLPTTSRQQAAFAPLPPAPSAFPGTTHEARHSTMSSPRDIHALPSPGGREHSATAHDAPPTETSQPQPALGQEDHWMKYQTSFYRDNCWWGWPKGIIDTRYQLAKLKSTHSEGTKLATAFSACQWVLGRHLCEFKIGMARSLGWRWEKYHDSECKWQPTHLFLLLQVDGREAVGYAEAGLIAMLGDVQCYHRFNINRHNSDRGGTGPRLDGTLHDSYFVYLAVKAELH